MNAESGFSIIRMYSEAQDYHHVQQIMHEIHDSVVKRNHQESIIITRFNPIKTTGRLSPVEGFITDTRGGGPTFHDPGQIVIYPILHHIPSYSLFLQNCLKKTISDLGFEVIEKQEFGVWINRGGKQQKVAFIGAQVKSKVTLHGCSVNLFTNLDEFATFDPCGLKDVLIANLGVDLEVFVKSFLSVFEKEIRELKSELKKVS